MHHLQDSKEKGTKADRTMLDRQHKAGLTITWPKTKGCKGLNKNFEEKEKMENYLFLPIATRWRASGTDNDEEVSNNIIVLYYYYMILLLYYYIILLLSHYNE